MTRIQFILGRGGTGKTSHCVQAAATALQDATGGPLAILTPEQATYQMERAVLARPGVAGYSRLRVLSFNRLAFWLNRRQRCGMELSRLGRQMATHRVLLELGDELVLYGKAAKEPGLAERLSTLLSELQQADCTPPQVALLAKQLAAENAAAARKWQDIAAVFAGYAAFFEDNGALLNPDTQLTQARGDIAKAGFLKGAHIWVDGFSGFTVQERELLVAMARQAEAVSIALCLDPARLDLENTDVNHLDPAGLFYSTEQTYAELLGIFRKLKFTIAPPMHLTAPRRYANAPALGHIEAHLTDNTAETPAANGAVEIVCCTDARAEIDWAAGRICELVRQRGVRYRQIALAVPQMDAYAAYVESAFKRFGIPYFLDRPAAVRHHPLAETLQAALTAAQTFSTLDVLCTLKSGLADVSPEQIDRLERYCLKHGIEGEDWTDGAAWTFAGDAVPGQDAAMDALRRRVAEPLGELYAAVFARDEGLEAAAFVRAVWRLLERLKAGQTLAEWSQGDAADTHGHRQTWAQLVATLDELERVFAGRVESAQVFVSTLANALSSLTIKLIPPTLDQVLVGAIERSRHPEVRAMFLVGATQKQFPVPLSTTDVLGRRERAAATERGLELAEPLSRQLSMRQYLAYIALTRASDYLAVSFPQQDEKGAATVPSVWVERLEGMFSDVRRRGGGRDQGIWQSRTVAELAERLAAACGKDRPASGDTSGAAFLLHCALGAKSHAMRTAAKHVMAALRYDNTAELSPKMIAEIQRISTFSATRLGTFAACPYQHFARYVLKLERRPLLRFEPMDIGSFYHESLESLFKRLQERKLSWGRATSEELATLCDAAIADTLAANTTIVAFMRRQRHATFVVESACQVVRRCAAALAELERAGAFCQAASEYVFKFALDETTWLGGKIDRVDVADIDGRTAAMIVDYKRTDKSPNWTHFFYGLDVQLMMYLLAIPSLPKGLGVETIAGAFYVPIEAKSETVTPDKLKDKHTTFGYKAKGIFNGDFAAALDAATDKGQSPYYNFAVSKDGDPYSYYRSGGALRPEDFETTVRYGRKIIGQLIGDLRSGAIAAAPYRIGKTTPCGRCDYKSVCRFDWQINDYRSLPAVNKETAIERMKDE